MRAVCLDFERRTVEEAEISEAKAPGQGEVLLRVREVGVCATDRELARFHFGEPPAGETLLALGHEAVAEVEICGPGVTGLARGSCVVPMIRRACPQLCGSCARGRFDLCLTGGYFERGINRSHGYFTSRVTDPVEALVAVPAELAGVAVLAEPLSVVEKAVETAMRTHPAEARRVCIIGAGPVGLLAAMALTVRGMDVQVVSIEPEDHPRVRLLHLAGIAYSRGKPGGRFDIVLEASGAGEAARAAVDWLSPCGVLVLIGAPEGAIAFPALRMVVDNLSVAGIVNAARSHFEDAFADLARIPRPWLEALIERRPAAAWRESLAAPAETAKSVHIIDPG